MVYLLAVLAAISNALTSVLQRMGVEDAPKNSTLKLSLLTHALRRGVWLLGFAVMILSFVFQAIALHLGSLAQVQPILTIELVFLMVILMLWFRFRVGWREWTGAVAASAGLAGFLVFASPASGNQTPDVGDWLASACPAAAWWWWPVPWPCAGPGGGGPPCSGWPPRWGSPSPPP